MTDPHVRHDLGDCPSGPRLGQPVRDVPPNSTPLRELAHAIAGALALPAPATTRDELTYLRIYRDRARLVLLAVRRILADRDIERDPRDVMTVACSLRDQVAQLGDGSYGHQPEPTL